MSTRSHIGIWNEDGSLDVIYCHWDGYPSYNGAVLLHHYQDPEKCKHSTKSLVDTQLKA